MGEAKKHSNKRVRAAPYLAAASLGLAAVAAQANTRTLARSGNWEAFGGTTTSGRPVCGVSQTAADGSYFGLKLFSGDTTFTIQIGRKSWKIQDREKSKIAMLFDANRPWHSVGTGMHFNDGDSGLEYTVNRSELDEFNREFRNSSQLILQFEHVADWTVNLAGSNQVIEALQECLRNLK
jgi:hypothetical protein